MNSEGAESICKATLTYHRALGVGALTSSEVWYWQVSAQLERTTLSLLLVRTALQSLRQKGLLYEQDGFWGTDSLQHQLRSRATGESVQKWRLLAAKSSFLPYIPYVRQVRALGSTVLANARPNSDLDISIATVPQRLWLCRLLITATAHILRRRRWGSNIQNRLCFNHYSALSNAPYGVPEPLFARMEARAIPLWDSSSAVDSTYALHPQPLGLAAKGFLERIGDVLGLSGALEAIAGRFQIARIASSPIPYPPLLPPPALNSSHLVFHYPKIEETRRQLRRGGASETSDIFS